MKTMKNRLALIATVFAFILVFAPTVKAEASGVKQTAATANSATVTWEADTSSYMKGWNIYIDGVKKSLPKNQTSYNLTGLAQGSVHLVELESVYQYSYGERTYDEGYCVAKTKPKKVSKIAVKWSQLDYIELLAQDPSGMYSLDGYTYGCADGFEIKIKDKNGKERKKFAETSNSTYYGGGYQYFKAPSKVKNKGMKVEVRAYITLANGTKVYGDTYTKVVIPQPKMTKLKSVGKNKVRVYWKKLSGAGKYTVYKTTNQGKKWKKVKTVSAKTTSCVVSGIKSGNKYGVLVVANNVKVGKKKYNSTKSWYLYRY